VKYKSTSRDEITKRILTARTWGDAARNENNPTAVRYTLAYDAARIWCEIVLRAEGLLVKGTAGHHAQTISAAGKYLGPEVEPLLNQLQQARKARNQLLYEGEIGYVTDSRVAHLIEILDSLEKAVVHWLEENHQDLLPLL
jgi:hypothetical protein